METLTVNRFKPYRLLRWLRSAYLWDPATNPYLEKYRLNVVPGTSDPADVLVIPCPHLPGNESFVHRDFGLAISIGHRAPLEFRDTPIICDNSMDYGYLDLPMRNLLSHPQVRYYLTGITFRDPVVYNRKAWSGEYHGSVLNQRVFYRTGPDIREERQSLPHEVQQKIKVDRPPIELIHDHVLDYINFKHKPLTQREIDVSFSGRTYYHAPYGHSMPTIQRTHLEKIWSSLPGKNNQFSGYTSPDGTKKFGKPFKRYSYPFEYFDLLLKTKIVISPWGWSPWCIRDLEALACGCIVIKPECSNMQIYPDIYNPKYQLMVWSDIMFKDLADQINYILENLNKFEDRVIRGRKLIYNVMYPNHKFYETWTGKIRNYVEACLAQPAYAATIPEPETC